MTLSSQSRRPSGGRLGSGFRFPRDPLPTPTPLSPSFIDFFVSDPPLEELRDGLEEYAWRCLTDGKRVRIYCAEIASLFDTLHPDSAATLATALQYPSLNLLYPLVTSPDGLPPSQLLPAASLLNLSRKQVIDVLARVSREKRVVDGDPEGLREQVLELCLEYIGRRWRCGEKGEEDIVTGIARKLTEITFELQLQGHPTTVRAIFLPIIHSLRFSLGLVSSNQLVTRMNSVHNPLVRSNIQFDPHQLVTSWLITRFRAGIEPQLLVDDLVSARDRLRIDEDKETLSDVLSSFGLFGRKTVKDSVLGQPDIITPNSTLVRDVDSLPKPFSRRPTMKKPLPITPAPGKWWSHRRNNSSSSRLSHLTPFFAQDRRPSLPAIASPSLISANGLSMPSFQSSSSLSTVESAQRISMATYRQSPTVQDLLASLMTYDKPEDIRFILLDHLLGMRYHLTSDTDDWVLGQGKITADDILSVIETRLVGRRDVMGLKAIFVELRTLFHLPSGPIPTSGYRSHRRTDSAVVHFPTESDRSSLISTSSDTPEPPESIHETASISTFGFTDRGVSFDLDEYLDDLASRDGPRLELNLVPIDDIASLRRKRTSTGNVSTMTGFSALTGMTAHRASMLSNFTIRQATRVSIARPRRVVSNFELASLIDRPIRSDVPSSDFSHTWVRSNRASVSEPDLLDMISALDLPDTDDEDDHTSSSHTSSIRRVPRWSSRLHLHNLSYPHKQPELECAPLSIPTIPSIPPIGACRYEDGESIRTIPSIPSLSSHGRYRKASPTINIPKNLAGFDTPPASPPLVDAHTITFTLDEVPLSPDVTPMGKEIRSFNRQWAIVDGEHVSPPRSSYMGDGASPESTFVDDSSPGLDEYLTAPNTPRPPPRVSSLRSIKPVASTSGFNESGGPNLRAIVGLFTSRGDQVVPKDGLREWEVKQVLRNIVDKHMGDQELARWLLIQLRDMLGDNFTSLVNTFLIPLPRLHTTPTRPSALRHDTFPRPTMTEFPLTPPPNSPRISDPEIPCIPLIPIRCDVEDGSRRPNHLRDLSSVSSNSFGSLVSTHTFGTPR